MDLLLFLLKLYSNILNESVIFIKNMICIKEICPILANSTLYDIPLTELYSIMEK